MAESVDAADLKSAGRKTLGVQVPLWVPHLSSFMSRFKLTIEYDGTGYHGWQRQNNLPTIQGEIEAAIKNVVQKSVDLSIAGRTDAGVHALAQVAHVDIETGISPDKLRLAINHFLAHKGIAVLNCEHAPDDFHARFNAKARSYTYKIINRRAPLTLDKNRAYHIARPINVLAMQKAALYLLGTHDFSTFRDSECQAQSPIKTLDILEIFQHKENITIFCKSKSFLHHQVRNMVGSLCLVGLDKWTPEDLKKALEEKDRTKGGPTAPACGLYFVSVDY